MVNSTKDKPPVAAILTLGGDNFLVVKLEGGNPSGKWILDIDLRREVMVDSACTGQCNKCSARCVQQLEQ
jgi:hypothetical protein